MKRGVKPGEFIIFLNESHYGITRRGYTAKCRTVNKDTTGIWWVSTRKFLWLAMDYCVPYSQNLITSEFSEFRIHAED